MQSVSRVYVDDSNTVTIYRCQTQLTSSHAAPFRRVAPSPSVQLIWADRPSKTELIFRPLSSGSVPLPGMSESGRGRPVMLIHGGPPGLSLPVNDGYHGSLQASSSLCHLQSSAECMTGKRERCCNQCRVPCHLSFLAVPPCPHLSPKTNIGFSLCAYL